MACSATETFKTEIKTDTIANTYEKSELKSYVRENLWQSPILDTATEN